MPHIPDRRRLVTKQRWEPLLDYVRARLEIQRKKDAGEPWPWTRDRVLQKHKFCCVFRDDDRTSREAREVIESLLDLDEKRCCAATFRLYNYVPTLRRLVASGLAACTDSTTIMKCILAETPHYNPLAYKVQPKGRVWNTKDICDTIAQAHKCIIQGWEPESTARQTCLSLHADLGMGGFVGYQAMQDLRWVYGPYTDEDNWCLVGIGAHRGLKRMMGTYIGDTDWKKRNKDRPKIPKDLSIPVEYRWPLRELLVECKKISERFNLFEIEHVLCESDKIARIRSGEGKGRYYSRRGK